MPTDLPEPVRFPGCVPFQRVFFALEPGAFWALEEENRANDKFECLKWLDKHPAGSILFVSLGTGVALSQKQLNELAIRLEQSGQRYLSVIKSPHAKPNASFFSAQTHLGPFEVLPNGVKDRGLVVSSWAPQVEILRGFLTHCGWNSILEVKVDENGVVGRNEIVKSVRSLINGEDGHNMRRKMSELKDLGSLVQRL
ncbi:UDP-glucuronosyl/UDP-glucosyltransferase [Artemisia annua]|uniref:UDP-glucuronosyl/UDP-glucosyltransferase n=1 Tax=Artemisia annua TaxID=35608 RepID=A0A2U1KZ67_ARTAN|nr:UDP-glucuronosyl/UDP-glucosyltransferase [Artemisia annua]